MSQLQSYNKAGNDEGTIPGTDILFMTATSMATSAEGSAMLAEATREGFSLLTEQICWNTQAAERT